MNLEGERVVVLFLEVHILNNIIIFLHKAAYDSSRNPMCKYLLINIFMLWGLGTAVAQQPDLPVDTIVKQKYYNPRFSRDSAYIARQKFVTDSIITHTWILPDSLINRHMLIDSIVKANVFETLDIEAWFKKYSKFKKENKFRTGNPIPKGKTWVLGFIFILLIVFGALRLSFAKHWQPDKDMPQRNA